MWTNERLWWFMILVGWQWWRMLVQSQHEAAWGAQIPPITWVPSTSSIVHWQCDTTWYLSMYHVHLKWWHGWRTSMVMVAYQPSWYINPGLQQTGKKGMDNTLESIRQQFGSSQATPSDLGTAVVNGFEINHHGSMSLLCFFQPWINYHELPTCFPLLRSVVVVPQGYRSYANHQLSPWCNLTTRLAVEKNNHLTWSIFVNSCVQKMTRHHQKWAHHQHSVPC